MGGEGRSFQKILIGPATERLLELKPCETVLDIACGNGAFTRRMAQLGAKVTGCDFSEKQLEFVFSIMHPCFNSNGVTKVYEEEERNGRIIGKYTVKVERYIHEFAEKAIGIMGQPVAQYCFHRPLNILLNTCFRSGFIIDAFEEPVFPEPNETIHPLSWSSFQEIPPVIVVRMKMAKDGIK